MKLLRNLEVQRGVLFLLVLSVIAVIAAWQWNAAFGIFTLILCIVFLLVHCLLEQSRYRKIAALSPEKRLKLMHDMKMLLSRIDWLITALLKISKLDAGTVQFHAEEIPLAALLHKSAEPLLIPLELRCIEFSMDAEGMFTGDSAWTCEAIGNILKNCMEHTPTEGRIAVHARENPLYTEIVISDTGTGIAKEDLPHIFERFYKGKHSDDSSYGIGLALARMIVTAQNGTIKVENAPDGGALFTIRFYKGTV